MRQKGRWGWWGLAVLALAFGACDDPTDDPSDCGPDEYYESSTGLCSLCPAVVEPQCLPGCGFEIAQGANGCPVARCAAPCACPEGQTFSDNELSCVVAPAPDAGSPEPTGDAGAGEVDAAQ